MSARGIDAIIISRRGLLGALARTSIVLGMGGGMSAGWAVQPLASIEILDGDSGIPLRVYLKKGRHFILGRPGARYAVRLQNHSAARLLIVLSVDGVNAISAGPTKWEQPGYVLDSGAALNIRSRHLSNTEVVALEFLSNGRIDPVRTRSPVDTGVVSMAVFREREAGARQVLQRRSEPAVSAAEDASDRRGPGARALEEPLPRPKGTADAGTGPSPAGLAGQRESLLQRSAGFDRVGGEPALVVIREYGSYESLSAAGIVARTGGKH